MAKRKTPDPLIEALENGRSHTITIADGGNLASMRAVLKHGQTLTFSPVDNYDEIQVNDIVIVKWRGGGHIMHLVGDKQDDQFLIINSLGKENGWTNGSNIIGRVTESIEPEPPPSVPEMLAQLAAAYEAIIAERKLAEAEAERLRSVAADMRWYADLMGAAQWQELSSLNEWSFSQHLWHLMKEAKGIVGVDTAVTPHPLIHHGKEHVGLLASSLNNLMPD
jgi:hypothetical protein